MGQSSCFVAVHFGAGFHSLEKENAYKKLMKKCCIETLQVLETSDNLINALVTGIKILEVKFCVTYFKALQDSVILNAGIGSNRNIEGAIEADASIMQLDPPCIGSVGGIFGSSMNPIEYARCAFYDAMESGHMARYKFFITYI